MTPGSVLMPTVKVDGRVDADVLLRERAAELDVDRHRRQAEIGVVLDDRPHEGRAAVIAAGGFLPAHLAIDDEDAVRRAALVARCEEDKRAETGSAPRWR